MRVPGLDRLVKRQGRRQHGRHRRGRPESQSRWQLVGGVAAVVTLAAVWNAPLPDRPATGRYDASVPAAVDPFIEDETLAEFVDPEQLDAVPVGPERVAKPVQMVLAGAPVIKTLGESGIPDVALRAYKQAEARLAASDPDCGVSWTLLAAIGRVESNHGRFGGAQLRNDGSATRRIRGIPLDGRPNVALIRDTDGGALDGDTVYDRAVGPMQFIPSTWRSVNADGNGDGVRRPEQHVRRRPGRRPIPVHRHVEPARSCPGRTGGTPLQQRRLVRPGCARAGPDVPVRPSHRPTVNRRPPPRRARRSSGGPDRPAGGEALARRSPSGSPLAHRPAGGASLDGRSTVGASRAHRPAAGRHGARQARPDATDRTLSATTRRDPPAADRPAAAGPADPDRPSARRHRRRTGHDHAHRAADHAPTTDNHPAPGRPRAAPDSTIRADPPRRPRADNQADPVRAEHDATVRAAAVRTAAVQDAGDRTIRAGTIRAEGDRAQTLRIRPEAVQAHAVRVRLAHPGTVRRTHQGAQTDHGRGRLGPRDAPSSRPSPGPTYLPRNPYHPRTGQTLQDLPRQLRGTVPVPGQQEPRKVHTTKRLQAPGTRALAT